MEEIKFEPELLNPMKTYGVRSRHPKDFYLIKEERDVPDGVKVYTCHYCLEPIPEITIDYPNEKRRCPTCRHEVIETMLQTPVHLFDQRQKLAWMLGEVEYVLRMSNSVLGKYFDMSCGNVNGLYDEQDGEVELINRAYSKLMKMTSDPQGFRFYPTMEETLENLLVPNSIARTKIADSLRHSKPRREKTVQLSLKGASLLEVTRYQIDLVERTFWGAFGYPEDEKPVILERLNKRAQLLESQNTVGQKVFEFLKGWNIQNG